VNYDIHFVLPDEEEGCIYLRVEDPYPDVQFGVYATTRSDGHVLPKDNAWRTYRILRFNDSPNIEEKYIHLFDCQSTGQYHIELRREYGTTGTTGTTATTGTTGSTGILYLSDIFH
jgi:hypothetical protein